MPLIAPVSQLLWTRKERDRVQSTHLQECVVLGQAVHHLGEAVVVLQHVVALGQAGLVPALHVIRHCLLPLLPVGPVIADRVPRLLQELVVPCENKSTTNVTHGMGTGKRPYKQLSKTTAWRYNNHMFITAYRSKYTSE